MTEEIIIDEEDKTKKHRNNEIDCLHFSCRKGESGKVLLWCGFYDDHCDNYTGCYYRKYLRLEKENEELKKEVKQIGSDFIKKGDYARTLEQENKELKETIKQYCKWLDKERESNEKLQKVYQNNHCDLLKYRSALEEIRENLVKLKTNDEDDFTYEYSKIEDKINEVLK